MSPSNVSVKYVFDYNTSQYKNYERRSNTLYTEIAVLPEGDLNGYWPGGFFTERGAELF
jgi:hypothetical protein